MSHIELLAFDGNRSLDHYLERVGDAGLVRAVAARDEMLTFLQDLHHGDLDRALVEYFRSGRAIARTLITLLRSAAGGNPRRILDFGSGYGRVTRHLVRELPPASLLVSDINAEAVRFQQEHLGLAGVVSVTRPEEFTVEGSFDAILAISLFTHLPEASFRGWLRALAIRLSPGGVLIFSVHDHSLLEMGDRFPLSGLLFNPISESTSLDTAEYGSTYVSEAFVRSAIAECLPSATVHRIPRGLSNFQDLFVVAPREAGDLSTLRFEGEALLFVESASASGNALKLAGWALRHGGPALREIEILLSGRPTARAALAVPRPDVAAVFAYSDPAPAGWQLEARLPDSLPFSQTVLSLELIDELGGREVLWVGTLAALLLHGAKREGTHLRSEVVRLEGALARLTARSEQTIMRMKESRFWKLRDQWFRLRRWLGVPGSEDI